MLPCALLRSSSSSSSSRPAAILFSPLFSTTYNNNTKSQRTLNPLLTRPYTPKTTDFQPKTMDKPVENAIRTKLSLSLSPSHLEVHNESHMHAVPKGSESHFRVMVVSSLFEGQPLIKRHRMVNEALKEELGGCVHALAIQAKTPEQWGGDPSLGRSPGCMGGSKGDRTVEEKLKAGRERD